MREHTLNGDGPGMVAVLQELENHNYNIKKNELVDFARFAILLAGMNLEVVASAVALTMAFWVSQDSPYWDWEECDKRVRQSEKKFHALSRRFKLGGDRHIGDEDVVLNFSPLIKGYMRDQINK
jgi:hypothetical protein